MDADEDRSAALRPDSLWTLYWADRNSRWHPYDDLEPTGDLDAVLREIG